MSSIIDKWGKYMFSEDQNDDMEGKLDIFKPLIGVWDLKWTGYNMDGSTETEMGEWFFFWALEGRAVQDLWIIPGLENRGRVGYPKGEYGTTIRYYDRKDNQLKMAWFGPLQNSFPRFTIHKVEDEIILESESDAPIKKKWIFSEIKPQSFRWRSEKLLESGWFLEEEMRVVRKPESEQ